MKFTNLIKKFIHFTKIITIITNVIIISAVIITHAII